MNDYDGIALAIDKALSAFIGSTHEPPKNNNSDSITMTKDGFITGVVRLQRLCNWVKGLSKAHSMYKGNVGHSAIQYMEEDVNLGG